MEPGELGVPPKAPGAPLSGVRVGRLSLLLLLLMLLGAAAFGVAQGVRFVIASNNAFSNAIKCGAGADLCPVRFEDAPVLPRCGGDLRTGLTDETRPFLRSVVNFLAGFIDAVFSDRAPPELRGMRRLALIQSPGQTQPLGVLSAIELESGAAVLAFRGTQTFEDLEEDVRMHQVAFELGGQVHSGFSKAYLAVKQPVLDALRAASPPLRRLVVCGHSLGAALAVLVSATVASLMPGLELSLVCFACPRIGDAAFCRAVEALVPLHVRVQNEADEIPKLPPAVFPNMRRPSAPWFYVHAGVPVSYQANWFSARNNHNVANYWSFLHGSPGAADGR